MDVFLFSKCSYAMIFFHSSTSIYAVYFSFTHKQTMMARLLPLRRQRNHIIAPKISPQSHNHKLKLKNYRLHRLIDPKVAITM